MDEQAQMQAIVDKLVGVPPETLPHFTAFDEPWRSIYRRARRTGYFEEAESFIVKATRGREDQYALVTDLVNMLPPGDTFTAYPSLHEISGRFSAVDWLWPS